MSKGGLVVGLALITLIVILLLCYVSLYDMLATTIDIMGRPTEWEEAADTSAGDTRCCVQVEHCSTASRYIAGCLTTRVGDCIEGWTRKESRNRVPQMANVYQRMTCLPHRP